MKAIVVGAGGAVGSAIVQALLRRGHEVCAITRVLTDERARALEGATVRQAHLNALTEADFDGAAAAVFTPLLTDAVAALKAARATPRLIFFSSNNVTAHADAYRALALAEAAVLAEAPHASLLRPTLIYGDPALAFMPRLVRAVRSMPIVPIPGSPDVRLQPIFFEDLAEIAARLCGEGPRGALAVGGAEVVTKAELLRVIARVLGVGRLFVPAPSPLVRIAARLAGARFPLDAAQLDRLDHDRTAGPPAAPWLQGGVSLEVGLRRLVAQMDL